MMGMTITEKILAAHIGKDKVKPGELIMAGVDLVLGNDVTAPLAIEEFRKAGFSKVFDNSKVVLVLDHFTPNKDIKSAEQCKVVRDFAREQQLEHFFEVGRMGIEHALLPEKGLVLPGNLVIGADSHTCTYGALGAFSTGVGSTDMAAAMANGKAWFKVPASLKLVYQGKPGPWITGKDFILYTIGRIGVSGALYQAMEFSGEAVASLSMDSRLSLCNMAIEAGAKNGIISPDATTLEYIKNKGGTEKEGFTIYSSDEDASYSATYEFDAEDIELQVAAPHLPSNTYPIWEVGNIRIDQVVIGSCTNGRMEDLRIAAQIMEGQRIAGNIRLIVIPATQEIYEQALEEGLLKIFLEAGAAISTPTCGPCLGGHMGVLAAGERALATTNRNFKGRMGHPDSEVYLAGPAVAAASAITGKISSPEEVSATPSKTTQEAI